MLDLARTTRTCIAWIISTEILMVTALWNISRSKAGVQSRMEGFWKFNHLPGR